jgi:membrane protein implicated in regulation of membrane protease activity
VIKLNFTRYLNVLRILQRGSDMEFADQWLWLIFIGVGVALVALEFLAGIETGFELVSIGATFVLGGVVAWPLDNWVVAVVVTAVLCLVYLTVARKYIRRWVQVKTTPTNVDAIIGRSGFVIQDIARNIPGRVRVGAEEWRANAEEEIGEGIEVTVTGVRGATLSVVKKGGENK